MGPIERRLAGLERRFTRAAAADGGRHLWYAAGEPGIYSHGETGEGATEADIVARPGFHRLYGFPDPFGPEAGA